MTDPKAALQKALEGAGSRIRSEPYLQYNLVGLARTAWPVLSEEERRERADQLVPLIPRCRNVPDPEDRPEMLMRLLGLPDEDLYDALRYDHNIHLAYEIEADEKLYPTGDDFLGRYLRWSRGGNAPLAYHFWAGLAVLGAACRRRVFYPAAKHVFPNMYIILGGLSAAGKGQAYDPAVALLHQVNDILGPQAPEDQLVRVLPSDATVEALTTMLSGNVVGGTEEDAEGRISPTRTPVDATGLLPLDEMSTFFGKDTFNPGRRASWLTTLKESNRYVKVTKLSGVEELNNLALSMLACCAPDWMQSTIEMDLWGTGFMDRCIWVYRDPKWKRRKQWSLINAPPKDPLVAGGLAQWIVNNIMTLPRKIPSRMEPRASEAIHDLYERMVDREHEEFKKYGSDRESLSANRIEWAVIQVATLLAVSRGIRGQIVITEADAAMAEAVVMKEEQSMKDFMSEAQRDKNAIWDKRIEEAVKAAGGCMQASLINQQFRKKIGATTEILKHIRNLLDQGLLEKTTQGRTVIYREPGHGCALCGLEGVTIRAKPPAGTVTTWD